MASVLNGSHIFTCTRHRRYIANVQVKGQRSRSQRKVMYQQKNTIIRQWIGSATSNLAWRRNESGKVLE